MSLDSLQAIVGTALVDRKFCEALLRSPELATTDFDLSEMELQAVVSIRARSLEEFAAKLDGWIANCSDSRCEPRIIGDIPLQAYRLAG